MRPAVQCYLGAQPSRSKVLSANAPKKPRRPLASISSPAQSDPQSGLPSPGVASPGAVILAPLRAVGHDLDLPMIDRICRSSFQAHKALQKWQRNVLAVHRREWDKAGKLQARSRTQIWRQQQTERSQKAAERSEERLPSPKAHKPSEDEGDVLLSPSSLASAPLKEEAGASRTVTPRVAVAQPVQRAANASSTPRAVPVPTKVSKPEQTQPRLRQLLKRRQEKRSQRIATASKTVQAMDADERAELQHIFQNNACTKEEALVGLEVHRAVLEAGLVGHDAPERRSVALTCRPPGRQWEEDGLTFAEFAGILVPGCRKTLIALRQEKLHKLLSSSPREWTGRVQRQRLLDAAQQILPAEHPEAVEDAEASGQVVPEIVRQYSEGVEGFSLPEIVPKLQAMSEEWWREQASLKRDIQERRELSKDTYAAVGNEIVHLDAVFQRVDRADKGYIERDEVEKLFEELGVVPQSLMQKRKTLGFLNEQETYDFLAFLKLVDKIRWLIIAHEDKQLHSSFMRLARDNAQTAHAATRRAMRRLKLGTLARSLEDVEQGTEQHQNLERDFSEQIELQESEECEQLITYDQLVHLLTEAAVLPESATSPRNTFRRRRLVGRDVMPPEKAMGHLQRILQDIDPSSRQLYTYQEVRLVQQRLREEIRQEARLVEAKHIRDLGYEQEQVEEMREVFRKLDPHGGGLLSEVQVEMALKALNIQVPHEACPAVAFHTFDFDLSGSIDYLEFLNMAMMARSHEGLFKPLESQLVTTLAKMDRGDLLLMATIMRVPSSRLEGISDTRLLYEVSEALRIGPDKELPPIIGGRSLSVLVRYAEKLKRPGHLMTRGHDGAE